MLKAAVRFIFCVSLFAAIPAKLTAQDPSPAVGVVGGIASYDLSGTGTTGFASLRLQWPIGRVLLLEPALTYLPYTAQFDTRVHHILPEMQLQVQWPGSTFRPYLGAGVGLSWSLRSGAVEDATDATLSTAAGMRIAVAAGWMIGGELRIRAIDPWTGTTAEWGVGISRSF